MDHIGERVKYSQELAAKRQAWEERRKAEAEQRERDEKQARLAAYLNRRGEAWMDHTGSLPPIEVVQEWEAEYMAERSAEQERDLARRRAEAEADIWG